MDVNMNENVLSKNKLFDLKTKDVDTYLLELKYFIKQEKLVFN